MAGSNSDCEGRGDPVSGRARQAGLLRED
eukprot:SAG31_NODE_18665_length_627_cov_1.147727_1_plen_28_part_10